MEKERLRELSRFVLVGILSTAIHYGIYFILLHYLNSSVSFTIGYVLSFLCNYGLSSKFTFHVGTSFRRFVGFGMSHAMNYFIQIVLLNLFLGLGVSAPLAPLPVYMVAVPVNYLMVRFALTRRSRDGDGYRLFLMAVGFAMLWLNLLDVPTMSDDMIYRFVWHADDTAPVEAINGVGDLFRSQWTHYLTSNGRFVPHFLAQAFFVFMPPVVLQVADTVLFVVMVHLCVCWVSPVDGKSPQPDSHQRLLAAVVVSMLLFVVFSGFRTAMLWGLGALNYLWPLVAVLSLLLFIRSRLAIGLACGLCCFFVVPLSLLAGWTHEALSLSVSIAFVAWLIANRKRPESLRAAPYMLAFMAGTMLCLLSPGIWVRAGDAATIQGRMISGVINLVFNVRVTWLLAIALTVSWLRDRRRLRSHLSAHRYEYIALAVSLGIVVACGTNLERVAFFTDFIAMLLLVRFIPAAVPSRVRPWLTAACCVVMLMAYIPAYMVRAENVSIWNDAEQQMRQPGRELIAVEQPSKGESCVMDYFREHYVNSSCTFGFYSSYMGFDANDINMRCAARLYGKERLTFLPRDIVERIERDSTAFTDYGLDRNGDLYVWRMEDERPVTAVTFVLDDEDVSKLMPHQRLLAYPDSTYELDSFNFEVVHVCGRPYLVFTKPTTNIYRRTRTINVKQ